MKRTYLAALISFASIPLVMVTAGVLFSAIDPEIAAGNADYERNYRLLENVRHAVIAGGFFVSLVLWFFACFLFLRSRKQPWYWLVLALLGPPGFAAMAMLPDREAGPTDIHQRWRDQLNPFARIVYEVALFFGILTLASGIISLHERLTAMLEAGRRSVPVARIIQEREASSGMWAFGEALAALYMVVFLYLLWPVVINAAHGVWRRMRQPGRRDPEGL